MFEKLAVRKFSLPVLALAALLWASVAPSSANAEETVLQLDPAQTHVEFTLGDVLHTVHGSFQLKRGSISFDSVTGKAGGEVVIDATSGNSGSSARDSRMHKNILESDRYPEIVFTPDRIEGKVPAEGQFQVLLHGLFKIHGVEHEMLLPMRVDASKDQMSAATRFAVPYVKWGMKNPSTFILRVNESVDIDIHAVGHVAPASTAAASR